MESRRLFAVVTAQSADLAGMNQGLLYTFDSPVSNDAVRDSLTIRNTNGSTIPRSQMLVTSTGPNQVRVTWPGTPSLPTAGVLGNGNYEAIIEDGVGSPFTTRSVLPFFFLQGDANFNRIVGFEDLIAVAQNYGASGKTYAQGDLDYDHSVGFANDLIIVAKNYSRTLLEPLPGVGTLAAGSTTSTSITLNFAPPIDPNTGIASTLFTGFHILRSADGITYSQVSSNNDPALQRSGAASYSWTNSTGLSPGTSYTYLVEPFFTPSGSTTYSGQEGGWQLSNEVAATTTAARSVPAPSNGTATAREPSKATLPALGSDDAIEKKSSTLKGTQAVLAGM